MGCQFYKRGVSMNYLDKKTVENLEVSGKKVLLRCDFNVPLDKSFHIVDTTRIDMALETIKYLLAKDAKIILCSHLGRPKGEYKKEFSLEPVAKYLSSVLNQDVKLAKDVVGESARKIVFELKDGDICMLENLRFEPGEEKNDPEFAKELSSLADIYVDDAFGVSHREHASTVGVTQYLPSVCGFLIEREVHSVLKVTDFPVHPFVAIIGGAKISDKIGMINSLLDKVDTLILGGGMSNTFMNALGYSVGNSFFESDKVIAAKDIIAKAKEKDVRLLLPFDLKIAKEFKENAGLEVVEADKIPEGYMSLDIGPESCKEFEKVIKDANTILWNGPMGVCEFSDCTEGTYAVAKFISESRARTVIGGGDSAAAAKKSGYLNQLTYISTGGGATLKLVEGDKLPALECLEDR